MAEGVRKFLGRWVKDNILPEDCVVVEEGDPRPLECAEACLADAEEEGFTLDEIEAEAGDLERYMARAINRIAAAGIMRSPEDDD